MSRHRHQRRRTVAVVVAVGVLAATAAVLLSGGRFWAGADPASRPSGAESLPVAGPPPTATTPPGVGRLGSAPTTAPPSRPPSSSLRAPRPIIPGGFPNAANTGWRHTGVSLKPYTGPSTIRTAGTVVDGRDMGCVWIQAANVVIRRSRIQCSGDFPVRVHGAGSLTIEDSEIDGRGNVGSSCITWERYVARRVDCHGVGDGMYITGANVMIEDSYLHDLVTCGSCHNDTLQATEGSSIVIRHNTMENQFTQTSVIKLGNETGPLNNVLVEQNLFNGGGYAVYGGGTGSNISGIRFFNNHFVRKPEGFFENCGQHGPVVYYDASMPGNAWSGNVWHDGGAPVQP